VAPIAISFGVLLSILGVVLYALAEVKSPTALIPSFIGVALIILDFVAKKDKLRMHAMHFAALLGLVGALGGVVMGILGLVRSRPATVWAGSLTMGVLCGVFLVLCIRSFIAARRARKRAEAPLK
jgi:quinol-cytochrome oxidoreductase complex cytochrome b subunit